MHELIEKGFPASWVTGAQIKVHMIMCRVQVGHISLSVYGKADYHKQKSTENRSWCLWQEIKNLDVS